MAISSQNLAPVARPLGPSGAVPLDGALGEVPAAFGRFLLLKRLSRGGMGEIFLAKVGEIQGFEKLIIIKKILPNLVANQDFIARFVDEATVAIKLNHANIAAVYEVGRVDGEYFLALEYVEGRDLRRLMQRCREKRVRLPVELCLYICRELCAGLAYAHRRTAPDGRSLEVVHCDISPPNIMLSFEGEVKVIDFGIARSALRTAGSNPNIGFGKFGYMAPEQLLKGGVIDRRTDIYAAGVVLYELLTGERLYQFPDGTDYRQIARTVCQGIYTPPSQRDPELDPQMDALVGRALAVSKEERYQSGEEFRAALQGTLSQLSPTLSGDNLAVVMQELFGGEREREQQELAALRALDVEAYQDELQGSLTHTVTFARHSVSPAAPTRPLPPVVGAPPTVQVASQLSDPQSGQATRATDRGTTDELSRPAAAPAPAGRNLRYGAAAALLLSAGVTTTYLLWSGAGKPPIEGAGARPRVSAAPTPRPAVEALPLPTPSPSPAPAKVDPPPEPRRPIRRPRRTEDDTAEVSKAPMGPSPQSVEAKFQALRREYEDFRNHFGKRLEDHWQQILQEAALGRRDSHLDDQLNQLRREMTRAKAASHTKEALP